MGGLPGIEQIFRRHHDFVWRVVRRLGVPTSGVDDAVQEVFVVLHRRRHELDPRAPIRALLYGIARRIARRHRERAQARARLFVAGTDVAAANGGPDRLELREMADALTDALHTLDEDKRMTFVLADIEGMTAPEIATAMDANVNTVYARLRAARKLLEAALADRRAPIREGHAR